MSFSVIVNGTTYEVPREVEAEGGEAIQRWLDAQLAPPAAKKNTDKPAVRAGEDEEA